MKYNVVVVGGGIVGLASALRLLEKNPKLKVLLIEKEDRLAKHQTGNNSGVIHSGIYYKPGSLKATNCISGYNRLLEFCDKEGVEYDLCGKVIVATDQNEIQTLNMIEERGKENGLENVKRLSVAEIKEYEPHVNGIDGLFVPQTGIINYTKVSLKYAEKIKELGGEIVLGEKVMDIRTGKPSTVITQKSTYKTDLVVNCGGLYSDKLAKMTMEDVDLKIIPFRGEYYELKTEKSYLVKNLIYPVPDPNFPFLGVHFTRMIEGGVEAGPNAVLAYQREGYKKSDFNFDEFFESIRWGGFQKVAMKYWKTGLGEFYRSYSKAAFTKALQKLIPEIKADDLVPGGAGVRAQACDRTGGLLDDFKILENEFVVNVCNAPSPAATSSLAIGESVSDMVLKRNV
ncbi:MAG: L-2-hydroxyglutarate oxidase [Arenicella sp.]|jgi:L-2-hydroxyglutarate oxidase